MKSNDYLAETFCLQGKVAALTGAGGFLVSEICRGLARTGIKVALLDANQDAAKCVAEEIKKEGNEAFPLGVDVRQRASLERALDQILTRFGALDYVLNGAGANAPTPFFDISEDEWNSILDVQLTGTMRSCQVFGRQLVEQKRGSIVNITSASSGPPLSKAFTYSVAKAAVKNLTQNLAREWAPSNVRVNALRPGFFPTEWSRQHFITPQREAAIIGHTPMGRYGRPQELVGAVLWLFSDAASFVTGAEIAVDGGFTAMTI